MRVLVISDVHSNLAALEAVLADAGACDVIWSLGDIVGYGPEPNACIARLQEYSHLAIAGNHDWAVLDKLDLDDFNEVARKANLWTREQLTPTSWAYLEALPQTLEESGFTLAHGSPRHPIWEYLLDPETAQHSFAHYRTPVCLVGHTHVPVIFRFVADTAECQAISLAEAEGIPVRLDARRYILNPGGVGQPRDHDPRAAYLVLDPEQNTIEYRRVVYDIKSTQKKMRAANLPHRLITRLEYGW